MGILFVLINSLFNGCLISLIYLLGVISIHKEVSYSIDYLLWGYGITILFMAIGVSALGSYLLRLFIGGNFATSRERQRIDPLLSRILGQVLQIKSINYQLCDIRIILIDSHEFNSHAIGKNTIILTNGLLMSSTDDELMAILAHEIGHLFYKDSLILSALIFGGFVTKILTWFYMLYKICLKILHNINISYEAIRLIWLIIFIPVIVLFPIVVLNWCYENLLKSSLLLMGRKYEYRADKFAAELGYSQGLISALEKTRISQVYDNDLIGRIFASHPSAIKRIVRL